MGDRMNYPKTIEEFLEFYSFVDKDEVYTSGSRLIPVFRVEEAVDHYFPKKAEWDQVDFDTFDCPICHHLVGSKTNFCSNCGTDMRGES